MKIQGIVQRKCIGMILNVYTFGYRDDTKCFDDIHVGNVITRQQKGGVSDSISSQCMKVNSISGRGSLGQHMGSVHEGERYPCS